MIELRTRFRRPLQQFVDCCWFSDGEGRPHRKERLLPTGRVDIVFKLRDDRDVRLFNEEHNGSAQSFGGAVVSGAYTRPYVIDTSQPSPTLGVHFRPGGAASFLGIPQRELTDRHIGLDELWGRQAARVRERLMEAASVPAMFDIVEQSLLERLTDPSHDYLAILDSVEMFSASTASAVREVSESLGYRSKRFIRLFHDSVGLTPKVFCRIQRFQSVLDRIVGGTSPEWVNVALDGGYYDQSHLIRDFRSFAGVTPSEYRPVAASQKNHMPLDG